MLAFFLIYSCTGWCLEVIFAAATTGQLVNRASGLCLTIPGDTTQENTQAVISQCSDTSKSQRWTLTNVSGR